jgi:DNA uptake protein ComE-like DNA-binding protein
LLSSSTELQEVLRFAPEWEVLLRNWDSKQRVEPHEFLSKVGAQAIFRKALSMKEERLRFVVLLRDFYYQPLLNKMLSTNQNLRRFLGQRHVAADEIRSQTMSFSTDIAQKMEGTLLKQLDNAADDGFKVLLPAYIQRTVHNAVVDFIRNEANWERQTLQDLYLDPQQDDPRTAVADDLSYSPEHQILSSEQVGQLNELRRHLTAMLSNPQIPREPLIVADCMFGMGLTEQSKIGEEMTMREVCDVLRIAAETQARRIARCQVLLDKGMDLIRQKIYTELPGIADAWQRGINVNIVSRRELAQQLSMTEGEIERLVKNRQFVALLQLLERMVVKESRLDEIKSRGAVAAFVPVDINNATSRDIMDILGAAKETAQRIVSERPFSSMEELVGKNLIKQADLDEIVRRGAVVRKETAHGKRLDLNRASAEDIKGLGVDDANVFLIVKGRPFLTWAELEEFLGDSESMGLFRQRFFLGLGSA